jgi:hypothetical protein
MKIVVRALLVVFFLACLVLPTSIAYAETPAHVSDVAISDGMGAPFQHHSFIDSGRQWVFYTTSDTLVYSTSTDMVTWSTPTTLHHCEDADLLEGDWETDYSGTQFDVWYDSTNNKVDIVLLNVSGNNSAILYARFTPDALTGTMTNVTPIDPWQPSLSGGGINVSYVLPSICVTTAQQPIIAYTKIDYTATPVIDVGVMGFANPNTGTLMALTGVWPKYNLSATGDASAFGSVIPLPSGNVSVQFVEAETGQGYLKQAIIGITGGADTVGTDYYVDNDAGASALGYLWDYNALSIHTDSVTASGNEDVFIVWNKDEGEGAVSVQFNRKGDGLWDDTYQSTLTTDFNEYVGAMGFRDSVGNIVYSAISWDDQYIYSANYDMGTNVWNPYPEVVYIDPYDLQWAVMANYEADIDGGNTGFIYQGYSDDHEDDVIRYGAYETSTPSTIPASVDMMAWIVVLVFGALVCLILLAYGASEAIKRNNTELLKLALVGFITLIIASIIVAELL